MHRIRLWVLLLGGIMGCAAGGHPGATSRSTDAHLLLNRTWQWEATATPAETIRAMAPDGLFLSNGPGDPEPCSYAIEAIREALPAFERQIKGYAMNDAVLTGVETRTSSNTPVMLPPPLLSWLTRNGRVISAR